MPHQPPCTRDCHRASPTTRTRCQPLSATRTLLSRSQDITRGRDMVDSLFQGFGAGAGGTHNAVLSSTDYLSTAMRSLGNIEDGFYIAPGKASRRGVGLRRGHAQGSLATGTRRATAACLRYCCMFAGCCLNACIASHPLSPPSCPCPPCSLPGQALHVSVQMGSLSGASAALGASRGAPGGVCSHSANCVVTPGSCSATPCFQLTSPSCRHSLCSHIAKNFLDLPKIKVPLILGIWGGKGQGKTFQCNLAYKKLGACLAASVAPLLCQRMSVRALADAACLQPSWPPRSAASA